MSRVLAICSYASILFIFLISLSKLVWAQSDHNSNNKSTIQISFVPGLSTSDSHLSLQISMNIIDGYNGRFHGVELGSVFNGNR